TMKIFKRSGGGMLFFLILLGYLVHPSPVMSVEATPALYIEEAKLTIEQARKAGAEQKALDDFTSAKSWLSQAEKYYDESKSVKSILSTAKIKKAKEEEVVFLATMAKLKAMIALAKAKRDTTIAELKDTQKNLADYQSSLAMLKEKIAEANKAKETQAKAEAERKQLEAAQQKLAELETLKKKELEDVRRKSTELETREEKGIQEAQLKETQRTKEAMERKVREEKLSEEQRKFAVLQARIQVMEREKAMLAAASNIPNVAVKLGDKKIVLTILLINLFTPANDLMSSGKEILSNIGKFLKAYPENKAVVQGYTDSKGKLEVNRVISEKRAQKVREYLVAYQNIQPHRVTAEGIGATNPVATNATETGRSQNRRMEVIIPIGQ
ncbi:MAG: OmpA family protein, partial [Syntrophales bacterium]|nr:OmpA family protein [Syntrophales bacterium]